jgi:hypothetical protein
MASPLKDDGHRWIASTMMSSGESDRSVKNADFQ